MTRRGARPGVTTLEIQVALVVLGIALSGLCPLIAMQMKLLRRIEDRTPPLAVLHHTPPDAMVRRLGGIAATVDDRVSAPAVAPAPASGVSKNRVTVQEVASSDPGPTASFSARVVVERP